MGISAKEKNKGRLLEYMGNPDHEFPTKKEMAVNVLKYKHVQSLYQCFTKEEILEIEREALRERRKRYSKDLADIDRAIIQEAKSGNERAAKLVYQRLEGWKEGVSIDNTSSDGCLRQHPTRIEIVALGYEDTNDDNA